MTSNVMRLLIYTVAFALALAAIFLAATSESFRFGNDTVYRAF